MKKRLLGVDINIFLLGIVSFLTDISSEAIFSVFSIFFTAVLGASTVLLGTIEGLADFSASSLDYVAGFLSDKFGKRKPLAAIGYGFSALAKLMLLIANSTILASMFRVIERLGKSFRGPPRDAWIASLSSKSERGYSFGIHKALDKSGAILGPLLAYGVIRLYGETPDAFRLLFKLALIPVILAVILLLFLKDKPSMPIRTESIFHSYKSLSRGFKHYLLSAGIFSLAYFSFSFLLLKAYIIGFKVEEVVLLYALFNVSFVIAAPIIGKLSDMIGTRKIIASSYMLYFLMCIGFLLATAKLHIILLFILFGIFYAIDESQSKAYITGMEEKKKATALGVYSFAVGLVYLPASLIAGLLWKLSPNYAFMFAAIVSIAALIYFTKRKPD